MTQRDVKPNNIQRGMRLQLQITDLVYGGKGLAKVNDFVIFVQNAIPGDTVMAEITKRQTNHAEAVVREIVKPSPKRVTAKCPLFGSCAGCSLQSISYEDQLYYKQRMVESTLQHLGNAAPKTIKQIIASPVQWRYRNKMEYTFGTDGQNRLILGFHYPGSFDRVFEVKQCFLQPEPMDAVLKGVTQWAREKNLSVYDPRSHKGLLRHLIMRHSITTNEVIAVLLTNPGEIPDPAGLIRELRNVCPSLKGFLWGINAGSADIARLDEEKWRWGELYLAEDLENLHFRISPFSFFQINTAAAVKLYQAVREMLGDDAGSMRLLDAYCGTGTIGIFCASKVNDVIGIEVVRDAIWDARENADRNSVENCTFLVGDMRQTLPLAAKIPGPAVGRIIVDPPRGGMDKHSLRALLGIDVPVFIYVSCNPATLSRDLKTIAEAGYTADVVQPVDLFPQTYHVETAVRFVKQ